MKITLSAAMRARDVSRPRPEQLAEAAAREEPRTAASEEARAARRDAGPEGAQPRGRARRGARGAAPNPPPPQLCKNPGEGRRGPAAKFGHNRSRNGHSV